MVKTQRPTAGLSAVVAGSILTLMPTEAANSTPLGSPAPDFTLPDVVTGLAVSLSTQPASPATLIVFLCRHCPYVVHVREELIRIASDYVARGLLIFSISSNDAEKYPDDAPDKLREMAESHKFPFPVLYDETQAVAQEYDAICTPDFFLYDKDRKLAYRGRLDDSTPGNGKPVTGRDLRAAIEAVLAGNPAQAEQRPSLGCSIKWK